MATKRKRSASSWEYIVKRKQLLPKPLTLTFHDETEGDAYIARLEQLLDAGIVPPEFQERADALQTLRQAINAYTHKTAVPDSDERILKVLDSRFGDTLLSQIDYNWAEKFVKSRKQTDCLAPSTIRHHIGALARMFDWLVRKSEVISNPFRLLPKGFANYTRSDSAVLQATGKASRSDEERDRRLFPDEEAAIRAVMAGEKRPDRERPMALGERAKIIMLFDLALETAMRLREIFTLTIDCRRALNIDHPCSLNFDQGL